MKVIDQAKTILDRIASIVLYFSSTAIFACALATASYFLFGLQSGTYQKELWIFFGVTAYVDGVRHFVIAIRKNLGKLNIYHYISAGALLIIGTFLFIFMYNFMMLVAASCLYFTIFITYSVFKIISKPSVRNIIISSLVSFVCVLSLITVIFDRETYIFVFVAVGVVAFVSLLTIINEAFSKIRFRTLQKILLKTYSYEILLGLVSLIISFSFVFMFFEGITYGDALWYCFAIVTTIGFGDIVVTSVICRILSVILGIYGILVVALITSIIVNLYNETKDKKDELDEGFIDTSLTPIEKDKKKKNKRK